jgi:drug/metabolite transporter (DMT)-like permease
VLWSSSWVIIRFGLDDEGLRPIMFAGLRYGAAALVLLATVLARPATRADLRTALRTGWGELVALGLVFYTVTQGAQFVALDHQPAATTSLVLSLTPLLVAVLAGRSLGERATRRQFGGAALVAVGAGLYFAGSLGATTAGMVAAGVALLANAASALLGRRVHRVQGAVPLVTTTVSMTVGAVVLLAAGLATEGRPHLTGAAVLIVAWLAVVNTALAFTLWNASLRSLTATESVAINNTMLIQIAILGWIFLSEVPGPGQLVGIVLVTAGIIAAQRPGPAETAGTG